VFNLRLAKKRVTGSLGTSGVAYPKDELECSPGQRHVFRMMLCQSIEDRCVIYYSRGENIQPLSNFFVFLGPGMIYLPRLLYDEAYIGQRMMTANPITFVLIVGKFELEESDGIRVCPGSHINRAIV
jgi:hypothetical protein